MSALRQALRDYVAMRQGLGYKFVNQAYRLGGFVTFMNDRDAIVITTKLAFEWATQPPGRHATWAMRISDVRGFARHLHNIEPKNEIPPYGIITYRSRYQPYIYTETEIQALLTAALALPPVPKSCAVSFIC